MKYTIGVTGSGYILPKFEASTEPNGAQRKTTSVKLQASRSSRSLEKPVSERTATTRGMFWERDSVTASAAFEAMGMMRQDLACTTELVKAVVEKGAVGDEGTLSSGAGRDD